MSIMPLSGAPARSGAGTSLGGRPWLLVGGALLLYAIQQGGVGRAFSFDLPDNDDAMRLVQVRDWLAGQGWFDLAQHRYLPPDGASMHWSRFVDLPIAGLILLLRPLLGERLAEGAAAAFWPMLVFLAFLGVIWTETRRLFGQRAAGLACVAATQMTTVSLWSAGRIDHHNVQATTLAAAALLVADPLGGWRRPALAGLLCALSLGIGLETVPFVAVVGALAALVWCWGGRRERAAFSAFGAALALGSALAFAAQVPPRFWHVAECDALSAPWLLLTVGGGAGFAALAMSDAVLRTPRARLAGVAILGAALLAAVALGFPSCLRGPYGALPELARTEWLSRVLEAEPAWRLLSTSPAILAAALGPLLAGTLSVAILWRAETGPRRRVLAMAAAFLVAGLLITQVQLRGVYIANALLPVAAGIALDRALAAGQGGAVRHPALVVPALATLGSLWMAACLVAEAATATRLPAESLLRATGSCSDGRTISRLDAVPPGLVLASTELGSSLLVHSRHAIVSAPYHRNGDAIVAGLMAERGQEAEVRDVVRRFRPDYLLVCADWLRPETDGSVLAKRLVAGESIRGFEPVPLPAGGLRLWRVAPEAGR